MMNVGKLSGKKICVAVSGGVDSLSLLHYLNEQKNSLGLSLSALHCEHGIRGEESIADGEFVKSICEQWGIPLYYFSENCILRSKTQGVSLETAARNFRLECYENVYKNGVDYIATAHHVRDEAETVLFRIARGSALNGAKGIEEMRGYLIRPFLHWTREEIEKYAKENGLSPRVDSTNFETDATRNKIRLEVLPKLEEAVPNAEENIARFARLAEEDEAFLAKCAEKLLQKIEKDTVIVLFSEEKPLFRRACLMAMKALGIEKDYTFKHLQALFCLQYSERGSVCDLPKNVQAERLDGRLKFYKKQGRKIVQKPTPKSFTKNGFDGGMYEVNIFSDQSVYEKEGFPVLKIDEKKLPANCIFRFREDGDFIYRFGGGKKSLKKFFNEEKIPVDKRAYIPLIADEKTGEIYVVCGVEISEKVKLTEETTSVLYITLQEKKEN